MARKANTKPHGKQRSKQRSKQGSKQARATASAARNDARLQLICELAAQLPMDVRVALQDFSGAYEPRVAQWLLLGVAGGLTLTDACTALGGQLKRRHAYHWLLNNEGDFRTKYHDALAVQAEAFADETISIADNSNVVTASADRLRITSRQWLMERNSRRFSARTTTVHEGNPAAPVASITRDMTPSEAAAAWSEQLKGAYRP